MTDEKTWLEKRREALAPKLQRPEPKPDTLVMATIESQAEDTAPEGDQPLGETGFDPETQAALDEAVAVYERTIAELESGCES